ncbi:hypothetical protein TWF506_008243 [Arthrobotrys conoides]|uniref:Uncharacterized protein n=1 Tax=Arthrobotrys conoides TaxID=74498 RepID=A0AAN8NP34_9PEZI
MLRSMEPTTSPTSISVGMAKNVLNGYYRIRNCGSGSFLSGISYLKNNTASNTASELPPFAVAAKACEQDTSSQVWIIRGAPNDNVNPGVALDIATGSQNYDHIAQPGVAPGIEPIDSGVLLIIELAKSSVSAGSGYPFRLEVKKKADKDGPLIFPGAPGLLDPDFPLPPNNSAFTPQVSSVAFNPEDKASLELVAAPRGGPSTNFQFISIKGAESEDGSIEEFVIYHPQTKSYLSEFLDNASNQDININLVGEAELAELFKDNEGNLSQDIPKYLRWRIHSEAFGPRAGEFRLIHSLSLTALGAVSPSPSPGHEGAQLVKSSFGLDDLGASISIADAGAPSLVSLNAKNCISNDLKWTIRPYVVDEVAYMLSNQQSYLSGENSEGSIPVLNPESPQSQNYLWKFMFVPSTKVATPEIPGIYTPPPKTDLYAANLHYIMYREVENFDIFLGLLPTKNTEGKSSPAVVSLKVPHSAHHIGESISGCGNRVARLLRQDPASFWSRYGWLIWRMNVFKKLPPDGVYTISPRVWEGPPKFLGISNTYPTAAGLNLLDKTAIIEIGTGSWLWNISTQVADNGIIYQYIRNYHSGHNINIYQNNITAFRTSRDSRWKRWHIVAADNSGSDVNNQLYLWTSHVHRSSSVEAAPMSKPTSVKLVIDEGNIEKPNLNQWWEFTHVNLLNLKTDIQVRFDTLPRFIDHQPDDFERESYLPDGLYKIEHRFTKSNLIADSFTTDDTVRLTKTVGTEEFSSTDTYSRSLWYVERDIQSTDITYTYTITNMDDTRQPMKLQERYDIVLQPYTGVTVALKSGTENNKSRWRLWKHKTLGYVIQSRGGSGGVLGVTREGKISTRPLLGDSPFPSNYWGFTRLRNDFSEGIYSISREPSHKYLSHIDDGREVISEIDGRNGTSSTWVVKPTDRGLYTIQNSLSMLYLSRTSDNATATMREFVPIRESCVTRAEPSEWMFQRTSEGLLRIRNPIANTTWNIESESAYAFSRIEPDARLFESRSSDKIAPGVYSITNIARGSILGFGTSRSLGAVATSKADSGFTWRIMPSTTGFYSISENDNYLSVSTKAIDPRESQPCVGVKGLDLALWKLVITQEGFYKIVNKETGLAIAPHWDEGDDSLVQARDDSASIKSTIWKIEMKEAVEDPGDASFERTLPDGPYFLENVSSKLVLGDKGRDNVISTDYQANGRDTIASKFQVFSIRKNHDGWYRISGYTRGTYLSLQWNQNTATLIFKESSMSTEDDTLDWRFVQQASTPNVTLVNQSAPELGFEVSDRQMRISSFSARNQAMLWSISPAMGTTKDTKFSPGVYLISAYLSREEVTARLATAVDSNADDTTSTEPPLALEYGDSDTIILNPLAPQNPTQMWTLQEVSNMPTENVYDILAFGLSTQLIIPDAKRRRWRFIVQNTGGFKIRTAMQNDDEESEVYLARSNKKLILVKAKEAEQNDLLWQIGRTGFYLQNQAVTLFNKVLAVDRNDDVQMINYQLSWLISSLQMSRRIWHLIKNSDSSYSLINEATRWPLHPQSGRMRATTVQGGIPSEFQKWDLVKLGDGIALRFKGVTTLTLLLGVTGERGSGVILRPGPQEVSRRAETQEPYDVPVSWKTWSMIPVAVVEGKPYMSLPRYLVTTKSEGSSYWCHTWQENSSSGAVRLSAYEPDNSVRLINRLLHIPNSKLTRSIVATVPNADTRRIFSINQRSYRASTPKQWWHYGQSGFNRST